MNVHKDWQGVRKIIAVRLDSLGDLLMTTPAIRALKDTFNAEISLLTSPVGAEGAWYVPEVTHTINMKAPWMQEEGDVRDYKAIIQRIKDEKADAAVIFTVYSQNPLPAALMLYEAEVPLRLGYSAHNPYGLLTHWVPDPEPTKFIRHEVERQLALVSTIGAHTEETHLSFSVPSKDKQYIGALLKHIGLKRGNWFIVHPGSRETRRCYPLEAYAEAIRLVLQQWPGKVVVTGDESETGIGEVMVKLIGKRSITLAGTLSLGEFGALVQEASLLVTNNTGPAHLAAALGVPVVDLYARLNMQHTPWQVPAKVLYFDVPCKQCERGVCAVGSHSPRQVIKPDQVYFAVMDFLQKQQYASF